MITWALLLGVAMGDPDAVKIADFKTEKECRWAEIIINVKGRKARDMSGGKDQPVDLYPKCVKSGRE